MSDKYEQYSRLFKESFKLVTRQVLKNNAWEDFRKEVSATFPSMSPEDMNLLLSRKARGHIDKQSNGLLVYGTQEQGPLFFRVPYGTDKKKLEVGRLIPTVFALWITPSLLPPVYVPTPVYSKITGPMATTLYYPGVVVPALPLKHYAEPSVHRSLESLFQLPEQAEPTPLPGVICSTSFDYCFKGMQLRAVYLVGGIHAIGVCIVHPDITPLSTETSLPGPNPAAGDIAATMNKALVNLKESYGCEDCPYVSSNNTVNLAQRSKMYVRHGKTGEFACIVHSMNDFMFTYGSRTSVPAPSFILSNKATEFVPAINPSAKAAVDIVLGALHEVYNYPAMNNTEGIDVYSDSEEEEQPTGNNDQEDSEQDEHQEDTTVTKEELSARIDWAVQFLIKTHLTNTVLPLNDTDFVNDYLRFCCNCPSMLALDNKPAVLLSLKDSAYKKVSQLLKVATKNDWMKTKSKGTTTVITSVDVNSIGKIMISAADRTAFLTTQKRGKSGEALLHAVEADLDVTGSTAVPVFAVKVDVNLARFLETTPAFQTWVSEAEDTTISVLTYNLRKTLWQTRITTPGVVMKCLNAYVRDNKLVKQHKIESRTLKPKKAKPQRKVVKSRYDDDDSFFDYEPKKENTVVVPSDSESEDEYIVSTKTETKLTPDTELAAALHTQHPFAPANLTSLVNQRSTAVVALTNPVVASLFNWAYHGKEEAVVAASVAKDTNAATVNEFISTIVWKAGDPPMIEIKTLSVGNKQITVAVGFEKYGFSCDMLVDELHIKQFLACSVTILDADDEFLKLKAGLKMLGLKEALYIQGHPTARLSQYITEILQISPQCIRITGKKSK